MIRKYIEKYQALPIQIKASFWFLICSFLQKGITAITTPIFTRLLSPAEYGQYNVFNSWLGIITIFVSLNLYAGVYDQGLVKFDKNRSVFSSSLQGLHLILVVGWTIIYVLFHSFWNNLFSLTTVQMLAMLLMIWSTGVFSFWATEQRVKFSYKKLVIITLFVSVAKPLVGIIFVVYADDKVTARILGLALVELIGYFGLFISQMRRGRCFFHGAFWKYAILYNLPLVPHYLSQTVLHGADRIMISNMIDESSAGIYSLAYSASQIMSIFSTALGQTMSPWIYQKIKDRRVRDIGQVAYGVLFFIATINILLIAFAPEVIAIFAPESYYAAIWVIPPVSMSIFFTFAYSLFAKFEFYYEKTQFIMAASIAAAILNVILNYVFIKIFGYYAAGYTTLFCYIVYAAGHYVFMQKVCKTYINGEKVYDLRILLGMATVFMGLGLLFLTLYKYMILRYLLVVLILVIATIKRKLMFGFIGELINNRKPGKPD